MSAVLEQYDRQIAVNKSIKKKLEKHKNSHAQLSTEINIYKKEVQNAEETIKEL